MCRAETFHEVLSELFMYVLMTMSLHWEFRVTKAQYERAKGCFVDMLSLVNCL